MRIGITVALSKSLWESGANQAAFQLAELFNHLNHTIVFVHSGLHSWWADEPIPSYATELHYTSTSPSPSGLPLDLLLDIDGALPPHIRPRLAHQTVIFLRTFLQFAEMDRSVYIETPYQARSMEHVTEVWCWDVLNPPETLPSIQTLFACPIRRVPFFWSPTWLDRKTKSERAFAFSPDPTWTIHVAEKNTNESSSVVPLVAIREAHRRGILKDHATYCIHNLDPIKENRFLKENVLVPIDHSSLPMVLAPKQPFSDWASTANHVFFSHSRFTPLRLSLLQLIWMGVPLIHNSPVLRDLHPTLQKGFYPGNEIQEWVTVMEQFAAQPISWWTGQEGRRDAIRQRFGIPVHLDAWRSVLASLTSAPSASAPSAPPPSAPSASAPPIPSIRIAFSDMWPGFPPQRNFLLDTLRHFYPKTAFHGALYSSDENQEANLIIVGPYSENWRSLPPNVPKIFFSAENWPIPDLQASLYLVASPDPTNPLHFRIPTWMTFVDWFTPSTVLPEQSTDNPIRIPLHFATHPHPISYQERTEFCAFVVSNPSQPFRNGAFQAIHAYKPVSSGGGLYNNIGGPLQLIYPGGGAGDLSKHAFFAKHRFTISAENAQRKGYITEKVLHAKMAGAVPLYWGDRDTDEDFAPNAIINVSHLTDPSDLVEIVKRLEARPELCEQIAQTPILNQEKTEKAVRLLQTMCERMMVVSASSSSPHPAPSSSNPFQDIYVINLDRRRDRWDNLLVAEPSLQTATRLSAVDGKDLTLTPTLARLFEHNHFDWKKGVIGCNLSHMMVWSRIQKTVLVPVPAPPVPAPLVPAPLVPAPLVPSYTLVLEDDVRFAPDWLEKWLAARPHVPADADLLYLGGVLPPNRPALPHVLEHINAHWSRIKPNTFFSKTPTTAFHFCAYSYILTPSGATKLMNHMLHSKEKYYTISDHMLASPLVGLTKYIMTPLVAHCFQEDDPAYQTSHFDQLQRTDTFDSDLWNNTDRFDPALISTLLAPAPPAPLVPVQEPLVLFYLQEKPVLYEHSWLEDIFQRPIVLQPFILKENQEPPNAWYLVQRPHLSAWSSWFRHLDKKQIPFRVLHLSDEFGTDDISWYSLPHAKAIVRTYHRSDLLDLLDLALPHLHVIPLGYHHKPDLAQTAQTAQKTHAQRSLLWSFHGTDWFNRKEALVPLLSFTPHDLRLQPSWEHPTRSAGQEYLLALQESKFCPIVRGNHVETFRLYEALEAGTLPVTTITDRVFVDTIEKEMGLSALYDWTHPERALALSLTEGDTIQQELRTRWDSWKARLRAVIQAL